MNIKLKTFKLNRPLNSARQKAANRWPVCTEWPLGSRRPLQAHHISFPERARELRRGGSHRTCPTCFQWWIHYWSQSPLSLCSYQHPGASSQPADNDRQSEDKISLYRNRSRGHEVACEEHNSPWDPCGLSSSDDNIVLQTQSETHTQPFLGY